MPGLRCIHSALTEYRRFAEKQKTRQIAAGGFFTLSLKLNYNFAQRAFADFTFLLIG